MEVNKVFDELGVLPATSTKGDPVIVGRINGLNRSVTFLIAWHVDTREL